MVLSFYEYLKEEKYWIFERKFRIFDVIEKNIYPKEKVEEWKKQYNLDNYAHCVFISKDKPEKTNLLGLRKSSKDIKNKYWFDSETKKYDGYLIEDSKITVGDNDVYLYVFKKNSNRFYRARQIHGFIYENQIKKLNKLDFLSKTHKWDGTGSLKEDFLNYRLLSDDDNQIVLYNGINIKQITYKDLITEERMVSWNEIPDYFKQNLNWNIKNIGYGKNIELGDFKRISGLEKNNNEIKFTKHNIKQFIFLVGIHDNTPNRNIIKEYFIYMPVNIWEKYLPNIKEKLPLINEMYKELEQHKLKGEREVETEKKWIEYQEKYKKITEDSIVKLRFKRDSKGQIRIQCSISYKDFKQYILKNQYIKIFNENERHIN